jgi:hypothetical protein
MPDDLRYESHPLYKLIARLRNGDLLLPDFQRDFDWKVDDDMAPLLSSLILGYPIGSLLLGRAESNAFRAKTPESISPTAYAHRIAERTALEEADATGPAGELLQHNKARPYQADYLFDGQQRLTTVDLIFGPGYHLSELHHTQRRRWFLNLEALGIDTLVWPNDLSDRSHDDIAASSTTGSKAIVVREKYQKTDYSKPYHYDASTRNEPDAFITFCTEKRLYPLDTLFDGNDSLSLTTVDQLITYQKDYIINRASAYQKAISREPGGKEALSIEQALKERFPQWKNEFVALLQRIWSYSVPCVIVPSSNLGRVAGIFEVINKQGKKLEIFDLLLARSVRKDTQSIRLSLAEAIRDSMSGVNDWKLPKYFVPDVKDWHRFWNAEYFLTGSRNTGRDGKVNLGKEIPDAARRPYAQFIALFSRISCALGNRWWCESSFGIDDNAALASKLRKLLDTGGPYSWDFADKTILRTPPEDVVTNQDQAARQLLRAYAFLAARCGVPRLSQLPYRQMDLALASVLTDSVWDAIRREPNGWQCARIEWWYWASIFGGAYQSGQDRRVLQDIPRLLWFVADRQHEWRRDFSEPGSQETTEDESDRRRFDRSTLLNVAGYSDETALTTTKAETAMGIAIREFVIRRGCMDFRIPDRDSERLEDRTTLHAGMQDLEADHLISRARYEKLSGTKVDRTDDHPVNSALNFSWISSAANRYWSEGDALEKLELKSACDNVDDSRRLLNQHLVEPSSVLDAYKTYVNGTGDRSKAVTDVLAAVLKSRYKKLADALDALRDAAK